MSFAWPVGSGRQWPGLGSLRHVLRTGCVTCDHRDCVWTTARPTVPLKLMNVHRVSNLSEFNTTLEFASIESSE